MKNGMDLYDKVEKVIKDHMKTHQEEVSKAKYLLSKVDVVRCNDRSLEHSKYWYDYDRNDPNRPDPFTKFTVTSGASSYDSDFGYFYSPEAQGTWPDHTEL